MTNVRTTLLAAGLLTAVSLPALAQQGYPRLVGDAYSPSVEYAPGFSGNIVGGGVVQISIAEEGRVEVTHADARFAQARTDGLIPVMLGGEYDHSVTWIAAGPTRRRDGSDTLVTPTVEVEIGAETSYSAAPIARSAARQPARRSSSRSTTRRG